MIIDETNDYEYFCHKYKVPNIVKKRFNNIFKNYENLKNKKFYTEKNIKELIYRSSKEDVIDLLLFSICNYNKIKSLDIEYLINYTKNYDIPKFPISGENLKQLGYEAGERLGKKLKLLEEEWIKNNFTTDKKKIDEFLFKTNKN